MFGYDNEIKPAKSVEIKIKKPNNPFTDEDINNNFTNYTSNKVNYMIVKAEKLKDNVETSKNILEPVKLGHIVGSVYDSQTGNFAKNALVVIDDLEVQILTDDKGRFEFENVPEGNYNITVKASGFLTAKYCGMPLQSNTGVQIYNLGISSEKAITFNYLEAIKTERKDDNHSTDKNTTENLANTNIDQTNNIELLSSISSSASRPSLSSFILYDNNGDYIQFDSQSMNSYLYYVVPNEMYGSSELFDKDNNPWTVERITELYKAQAVASRTFAEYKARHPKHDTYTICAQSSTCQKYINTYTNQTAINAVLATDRKILYEQSTGIIRVTQFMGTCHGTTYAWNGTSASCTVHPFKKRYASHDNGMCQNGAAAMIRDGKSYLNVLTRYYPGLTLVTGYDPINETRYLKNSIVYQYKIYIPEFDAYTFKSSVPCNVVISKIGGPYYYSGTISNFSDTLDEGEYTIDVRNTSIGTPITTKFSIYNVKESQEVIISSSDPYTYVNGVTSKVFKFLPKKNGNYTIQSERLRTLQNVVIKGVNYDDDNSPIVTEVSPVSVSKYLQSGIPFYFMITTQSEADVFDCKFEVYQT